MELTQLRYFCLVCREKNFTKAAKAAFISQPSMTNSIRKLEDELGTTLFDRSRKQTELTPEGKIFYRRAIKILRDADNAAAEQQDLSAQKKKTITLGITPVMAAYYFTDIFLAFKTEHPDISLNIREEGSKKLREMLAEGELDMALGMVKKDEDIFDTRALFKKQLCISISAANPLADKKSLSFEDIRNLSFILYREGSYIREYIFSYFRKNDFEPQILMETNQLEIIKAFVAADAGVAMMFEDSIDQEDNIVSVPLDRPLFISSGLLSVKNRYITESTQIFIEFVRQLKG